METFIADVEKITFRNESNYYTVAVLSVGDEKITAVGTLPFLNEGDTAEFTGTFVVHQTYGEQFKVESFERKPPQNTAAILRYLSSGSIKGVGPSTAARIVEKFGAESLDFLVGTGGLPVVSHASQHCSQVTRSQATAPPSAKGG